MAIPKKAYLLSFFSRHHHKIMKLKCKARQYLSLFSCNCVSHMTNYVNFKLSKDVEKNPGPTQYNTDHHEVGSGDVAVVRALASHHCGPGTISGPGVTCGLKLLLILALLQGFFSGFSGFPPSTKINTSKF